MSRKQAILKAAIHLFAERGFKATPTSAVAKKAGVAEGLIFHHFKNKQGIFVHILNHMIDAYLEGIEAAVDKAHTGLEAIENIVYFHFRFSEENSDEFLVVIRDFPFELIKPGTATGEMIANRSGRVLNLIRECIDRGKRDGSIQEVPSEETAFILRGMLNGLSRMEMMEILTMPDLTSEVVSFCRRSLVRQDS